VEEELSLIQRADAPILCEIFGLDLYAFCKAHASISSCQYVDGSGNIASKSGAKT
jgi:hypothetical protein